MNSHLRRVLIIIALAVACAGARSQDSVVTGPDVQQFVDEQACPQETEVEVKQDFGDLPPVEAPAVMLDSGSAEREAEAFFMVSTMIAAARPDGVVPSDISRYVDNLSPSLRTELYNKYSKVQSIVPALVNFFPIPFLGNLILNDSFGGYILIGAVALLTTGVTMKLASRCIDCRPTEATIMFYAAAGLATWVALRPFYLVEKNSEYNKALAGALKPPSLSYLSIQPILQQYMAGVVVPTLQVAIGF